MAHVFNTIQTFTQVVPVAAYQYHVVHVAGVVFDFELFFDEPVIGQLPFYVPETIHQIHLKSDHLFFVPLAETCFSMSLVEVLEEQIM